MAVNENRLFIVGCGPGGPEHVTPAARDAVAAAQSVLGSQRLLQLFPQDESRQVALPPAVEPAVKLIAEHLQYGPAAVLVSGDPGAFSLAQGIVARFGRSVCTIIPGISSLQAAFARLGLSWIDSRIISAHGRIPEVSAAELCKSDKIAVFGGTRAAADWVCEIASDLSKTHTLFVCENLTLPEETVRELSPAEIRPESMSSLALLVLVRRSEFQDEREGSLT